MRLHRLVVGPSAARRPRPRAPRRLPAALGPLALGLLCLAGCYRSHERAVPSRLADGGGPPDGPTEAGADAGVDAGPAPIPACTLRRAASRLVGTHPEGSIDAPDLFWTGERVGALVFVSDTVAHPIVSLAHLDPELREVTPLRQVGEESHGWGEAAWTGDAVGLCWNADPGGRSALRFREVEGIDGPLGPRTDFDAGDGPCMDLEFAHGRYAMTWRGQRRVGDETIVDSVFQLMARDGRTIGERIVLATAPYPGRTPDIVALAEGFLVAVADGEGVRVTRVDPEGRVLRDGRAALPGATFAAADVRDGLLALVALAGEPGARRLVFGVYDADLRPRVERTIEDGAPTASYPRVLARPEGYVLAWAHGARPSYRAMWLSLDPDGVPLAPRALLHEGTHSGYGGPSLLSVGDSVYVGLSHGLEGSSPGGREYVHVERWTCDAPPEDPCRPQQAQAGDCDGAHVWGFRWTGERCEAVVGCASDCIGEDCGRLSHTRFACESDRRECGATACAPSDERLLRLCHPRELPSGAATRVTLGYEGSLCPCDAQPTCHVELGAPFELHLRLERCDEGLPECDCAPTRPVERAAACVLPPLGAGTWTLRLEGGAGVEVLVRPPWEPPAGDAACVSLEEEG